MASTKRERELARMRMERQAARRAAAEARRRQRRKNALGALIGLAVVAVLATFVVNNLGSSTKTGATCSYAAEGKTVKPFAGHPAEKGVRNKGTQVATLTTTRGVVTATLLDSKAPCTVNSFAFLAKAGYFDGTPCHRLTTTPGLKVLQCGSPDGSPNGGPGYKFADENLKGATYLTGTLAMANSGAGTNGSQFFLVYGDSQLPASYTPFGTITSGLDVLTKVAAGGTATPGGDGPAKLAISLTKVTVS